MSREQFVERLGWVFEDSPWVAEAAYKSRPFASCIDLHRAMAQIVEQAGEERQRALLCTHPDLGLRAKMSQASQQEQSGAGMRHLTPQDRERLRAYRARFGFPFLFAVKGSDTRQIIEALERRILSTPAAEFREALAQVYRIAEFRLLDTICKPSPAV